MTQPLILVTNDDGINSPGLHAAIEAVLPLGEVIVVAPHEQNTGAGRSFTHITDRRIFEHQLAIGGQTVTAYSLKGTPARCVATALLDFADRPVDLVVSGINYGENIGNGVTVSGTVGAALEAAAAKIPALAVSRQTSMAYYTSHSNDIDFSVAGHFVRYFARTVLQGAQLPADVDVLKIDIPMNATPQTDWRITRVSRQSYFAGVPAKPPHRGKQVELDYAPSVDYDTLEADSDIHAVVVDHIVSVSPLSIDLTSRTSLPALKHQLNGKI